MVTGLMGRDRAERAENIAAGRAGRWPGPPAPADADLALAEDAVRSQVALAFSALRADVPWAG